MRKHQLHQLFKKFNWSITSKGHTVSAWLMDERSCSLIGTITGHSSPDCRLPTAMTYIPARYKLNSILNDSVFTHIECRNEYKVCKAFLNGIKEIWLSYERSFIVQLHSPVCEKNSCIFWFISMQLNRLKIHYTHIIWYHFRPHGFAVDWHTRIILTVQWNFELQTTRVTNSSGYEQ